MPVPVQSELEPIGKYFLIRAMHIDVNGVRLDKVINEVKSSIESIKTDYYTKQQADDKFVAKTDVYTKSEVDTALSGKVSVQSGYGLISDAEKAQIQTNKSGIAAAETAIAGKASTEAVAQLQTDMAVQEARMDQLVGTVPEGSADEIADARVTADGKTEANLGNAIRSQVTSLKETIVDLAEGIDISQLSWVKGYINNSGTLISNTVNSNYTSEIIEKSKFEKIKINTDAATNVRIVYYNTDGTFNRRGNAFSGEVNADNSSDIRLVIGTLESSDLTASEVLNHYEFTVDSISNRNLYNDLKKLSTSLVIEPNLINSLSVNYLTDANDAKPNTIYTMVLGKSGIIDNIPSSARFDNKERFLITVDKISNKKPIYVQYVADYTSILSLRSYDVASATWGEWTDVVSENETKKVIVDINGNGDYTSFTDALEYANTIGNCNVYVRDGVYDMISELGDRIETIGRGPVIGNNVNVYFDSKAIIECKYTGSSSSVMRDFSPINAGRGDFEMHNVRIKCKNVRYGIHDERGSGSTAAEHYIHRYYNCEVELDNSGNTTWNATNCIGGGLGSDGIIEVIGGRYTTVTTSADEKISISYHNRGSADARSQITIKDVYADGTFRFGYLGTSEEQTNVYVSNCSLESDIIKRAENDTATVDNITVYAWNNVIRNS